MACRSVKQSGNRVSGSSVAAGQTLRPSAHIPNRRAGTRGAAAGSIAAVSMGLRDQRLPMPETTSSQRWPTWPPTTTPVAIGTSTSASATRSTNQSRFGTPRSLRARTPKDHRLDAGRLAPLPRPNRRIHRHGVAHRCTRPSNCSPPNTSGYRPHPTPASSSSASHKDATPQAST